ncbi:MAG TPA: recombinase zinc beta ribbon domain-containing protein [Geminicoccaceae bacterium]|nr:recombinase zinc beta ribbon domain-containing protein [Geminicoccaceae bacterium]
MAAAVPGWPVVPIPFERWPNRWTMRIEELPPGLRGEIAAFLAWARGEDADAKRLGVSAGHRRRKARRPATVQGYRYQLRAFVTAVEEAGVGLDRLTSLAALLEADVVEAGIRRLYERSPTGGDDRPHKILGMLKVIGRDYLRLDDGVVRPIAQACRDLRPEQTGMHPKNVARLAPLLGDPRLLRRLLNNELYAGRLVWNRCSYVKDPRSGRRLARPNPPEKWERAAVPELRVVDDELWRAVKARQAALTHAVRPKADGNALNAAHRRRFLLSGLLVCGACGGGYTIMAKDRYGCAARRDKGTCANDRTIRRQEIEGRVLEGLKHRLLAPELIEAFARSFQEESRRREREQAGRRTALLSRLGETERRIAAIVRAVEDGLRQPAMKARLAALEAEKGRRLAAELAALPDTAPVTLHPNLPALYRRKVEELERPPGDPELGREAMEAIRAGIAKIVLAPRPMGGMAAELHGDLAAIMTIAEAARGPKHIARPHGGGRWLGRQPSLVAGAGFEPATFRL